MSHLREEVVPAISQAPGFVAGYWTGGDDGGMSMVVFESEDAARIVSDSVACNSCGVGITTIKAIVFGSGGVPSEEGGVLVGAPTVWLEGITFRAES